jgi:hypothetical protein
MGAAVGLFPYFAAGQLIVKPIHCYADFPKGASKEEDQFR